MDTTNVAALRRVMDAFIRADGRSISLLRRTKVDSGAGSWVWSEPETLPHQLFRLIPMKRRLTDLTADTQDGEIPSLGYVMIGKWNSDIRKGDYFLLNGTRYEVTGLEPHANEREHTDRVVAQTEVRDG